MACTGALIIGLAFALVIAVADLAWVLPIGARRVALIGLLGLMVGSLIRQGLLPGRRFSKDEAAAEVESSFPELGQRLRTVLEYSEPRPDTAPAWPGLVRALVSETDRQTEDLDFPAVVPWGSWKKRGGILALGLIGLGFLLVQDPNLRIAARRLLLLPAFYTTLAVEPGDQTIREGSEFRLKVTLTGRPVTSAQWLQRPISRPDPWTVASLARTDGKGPAIGRLEASRNDCRSDFEYRVVAGELESPTYRVTVTHPLTLQSFQARIEPPGYTRLNPSVVKEGNFPVPEGSKVRFQIGLDRAPATARIVWTPSGSKTPVVLPLAVDGRNLTGELPPLTSDVRYEVVAIARDGMKLDPARFQIKVKPDGKPSIQFLKPSETRAALPTTEVPVKAVATDDYGLSKVGIRYKIGDGPEESLYLNDPKDQPPTVEALATLYLEKHPLTIADSLSYRAFAEDNREPEHQKVSTELRFIDILPYKQDYQVVEGGEGGGGSSVTLEELILRQRQVINRTLAHENDPNIEAKVADRLANEEAEISTVTRDFAASLAQKFGPVPALDEAIGSMEEATVTLASREFPAAIPQEEAALTALTKARMNLRKLLSNSSTASACRKIDRQQQDQKIRKPPAEKSKEAERARLEQDLKKLAETEKKFAKEIEPKATGGAKLDQLDQPKAKGSKPSGSPASSPAERQQAAAQEAKRLQALAKADPGLTDLVRKRMDQATAKVQEAEAATRQDRPGDAAEAAKAAGEVLDRLAEQVGGLKAKEIAEKLARARDLARETSRSERELAARSSGTPGVEAQKEQQGLVEDAKTLADLMKRLKEQAVEEDRTLARAIDKATESDPIQAVEEAMRQALAALEAREGESSNREMLEASKPLEALARDLETARRDFMAPRLQQLIAAEKEAAEVRKALESVSSASKKAGAEKALADLARSVNVLKAGDGPLQKAAEALSKVAQGPSTNGWSAPTGGPLQPGLFRPPVTYSNAVREISKALQARIQELILGEALVDRDGPVPPGYKEKVEDYFRLLSEDLR